MPHNAARQPDVRCSGPQFASERDLQLMLDVSASIRLDQRPIHISYVRYNQLDEPA